MREIVRGERLGVKYDQISNHVFKVSYTLVIRDLRE